MVKQQVQDTSGTFQTVNPFTAFANVQGNILKGHGREFVQCIFLNFLPDQQVGVRGWINTMANDGTLTSATKQLQDTETFHNTGVKAGLFGTFFLTHKGYEYLNINAPAALNFPADPSFQGGMEAAGLNDPALTEWDQGFRQADIHGMLLLADENEQTLQTQATAILAGAALFLGPVHVEHGNVLNNPNGDGIEHFGYVDGVSQPIFIEPDVTKIVNNGQENPALWDPAATLDLVLVKDPNAADEDDAYGSYFVFRKLEQNVQGFKDMEEDLAHTLGLGCADEERAGALLVGRFEDGTPVTMQASDGIESPVMNGFNYANDMAGSKCPFHAHIRKTNPRGDTVRQFGANANDERGHRIARRGIPYGKRKLFMTDKPTKDVGLLFMCYQKDIANQFEFMQKSWANEPNFVRPNTGLDPIIGQGTRTPQEYPNVWAGTSTGSFTFAEFVTFKGGEYFFAPSLSFLRKL
jgi:Dyp-type peroxidase family